ncbi:unnamed protein product [Paramecium sonneborni]|uniref:MORN repeat protein n=1 Tax=Paramecium sonneborni TaxID=65129 RepID=A0A8S1RLI6_9CILI|nr:unnamed protein product [Paramecium sonneborni]
MTNIFEESLFSCCQQPTQSEEQTIKKEVIWNEDLLENVGGYYYDGKKQGIWKEKQGCVILLGEYYNDLRTRRWIYIFNHLKIGGGLYNSVGKKKGKWIEVFEGFKNTAQVTYNGDYNVNGMKIGKWDIMYRFGNGEYQSMGGGSYDEEGNQKKIGKWVELDEGFNYHKQITYNGEYNMNGMKVGRWDTIFCNSYEYFLRIMQTLFIYKKIQIYSGGGSYNQEGNQKKIGRWEELDEQSNEQLLITYKGQYNVNGCKEGQWEKINRFQKNMIRHY